MISYALVVHGVNAKLPFHLSLPSQQSQALVERQSAFYSLQRKHKSCRQQLETKELQLALLQKKVATMDQRLSEMSLKESEWDSTIDRVSWFLVMQVELVSNPAVLMGSSRVSRMFDV